MDWVLIATKAYDSAAAAKWLDPLADERTRVAVLQNGVEHRERFAPYLPADQLVPVVVDLPAQRRAPGRVVQRGSAELTVPQSADGLRFADLFAGTPVRVRATEDFASAAWTKLALNVTGAITAATLIPRLDMSLPSTESLVRRTVEEAVAVGRAEGAELPDTLPGRIVAAVASSDGSHVNSLHADRLAGRPMEIDARNGAVVRIGRRHGIETPVNSLLVDLLSLAHPAG